MIVLVCPGCSVKVNAKDELAGKTRKCPKCGTPIRIPDAKPPEPEEEVVPLDTPTAEQHAEVNSPEGLAHHHFLSHLDRQNYYVICDKGRVFAAWEANGRGWMLKTSGGMVSAARNPQQLPAQGDFRLVEVKLRTEEAGLRLTGIGVYRLVQHYALASLTKGDDEITRKIAAQGGLNREQKGAVRDAIKHRYMQEVWAHAQPVLDYLASADFHSPGVDV